jgi:hypothetical protein
MKSEDLLHIRVINYNLKIHAALVCVGHPIRLPYLVTKSLPGAEFYPTVKASMEMSHDVDFDL